ncbi:MAG TPA: helix-turn-helix transcriptional regulator [Acidimicrobiales bacterium]|nr:helix-turn-helix transcriptional regulator [Acidimicrobiales bacterium]
MPVDSTTSLARRLQADPAFRAEWEWLALGRAVALRLTQYRAELDLSQTAVARQLGMQQTAVARLESGDHNPNLETLVRLSRGLGVEFHIDITPEGVAVELTA